MSKNAFGPRNKYEEEIFAVERFRVDIQSTLYKSMKDQNISMEDLAERMDVNISYIESVFEAETELSIRELAKICFYLNQEPILVCNKK